MTQLESARAGRITDEMRQVAEYEQISPEQLRDKIASGRVVIPKNAARQFVPRAIGKGLCTKVNANIGTSPSRHDLAQELAKLDAAVAAGADAVMDLSTGGDLDATLRSILDKSPVMVGTVPVYKAVSRMLAAGRTCIDLTSDDIFDEMEAQDRKSVV